MKRYEYIDIHCVGCGKKTVYTILGSNDYYCGDEYICRSCGDRFFVPFHHSLDNEYDTLTLKRHYEEYINLCDEVNT